MGCVDCQWNRSGPGVIIRAEIRCGNPICARHQRLRESSFFISASLLKLNENYWLALPWRPAISLVKHQKNENALHQSEVQTQRDWHRPGNWIPVNKSSPETSSDAGRRHASNQSRQVRGMFYFVALTALDLFGVKRQFFFEKNYPSSRRHVTAIPPTLADGDGMNGQISWVRPISRLRQREQQRVVAASNSGSGGILSVAYWFIDAHSAGHAAKPFKRSAPHHPPRVFQRIFFFFK